MSVVHVNTTWHWVQDAPPPHATSLHLKEYREIAFVPFRFGKERPIAVCNDISCWVSKPSCKNSFDRSSRLITKLCLNDTKRLV